MRRERGAILLELSLSVILLTLLTLGVAEYGNVYSDALSIDYAARTAAETATSTERTIVTDDKIIAAAFDGRGGLKRSVERLVIYRANSAYGVPPAACQSGSTPPPSMVECNVYTANDFGKTWDQLLDSGKPDNWPPDERAPETDYVGVWIKLNRPSIQKMIWSPNDLVARHAMMLEPRVTPPPPITTREEFSTGTFTQEPFPDPEFQWMPRTSGGGGGGGGPSSGGSGGQG